MKRTLLMSVAALAFACGGGSPQPDIRGAVPNGSAQSMSPAAARAQPGGDQGGATQTNQTVTLVGCLIGPGQPAEPTGTAGTRARARATGPETAPAIASDAPSDRFMLVDAVVPGDDLGGTGANGAGPSGGPLVSGKASFELDGVPADARGDVNKRVRIVGRLDARPAAAVGSQDRATGTDGRDAGAAAPTAGNGQKSVAGHGTMGSAARSDIRNQRLASKAFKSSRPAAGGRSRGSKGS
jgi:hypothetical protein